ncbi:MAG: hypothetical protein ACTHK4_12065 [Mycobacteriales bacterium]
MPRFEFPGGSCDDTVSHACWVSRDIFVTVDVYVLVFVGICWLFWRFRWWPLSKLRARRERMWAEVDEIRAREAEDEAAAEPPSEDEKWERFKPDAD